jgi:hypothetical protein
LRRYTKLRDTDILCDMLTYVAGMPDILEGDAQDEVTRRYSPPFDEFQLEVRLGRKLIRIPDQTQGVLISRREFNTTASIQYRALGMTWMYTVHYLDTNLALLLICYEKIVYTVPGLGWRC